MARIPKYLALYVLQGFYSHGWEDLTASYDRSDMVANRKEYRANEAGTYRIVSRPEDNPDYPGDESVKTWADGFGVWHARVSFPTPGYGNTYLDQQITRIRTKARRAIRREILAREQGPIAPVRVHVTGNDEDHMGRMLSLTFSEVTR